MRKLPRLCVRCGRRTTVGLRLVGERDYLVAKLTTLTGSRARAESLIRGDGRRGLHVSVCKGCARRSRFAVGNPPPTIAQPRPR